MYCKHCGKEIADDSKFCNYCGGGQLENLETIEVPKEKMRTEKNFFSENVKFGLIGYGLWVVLNLYWLLSGEKSDEANIYFQPFAAFEEYYESYYSYYDVSEFVVYTLGLPLLIVGVFLLIKHIKHNNQVVLRESKDKVDVYKAAHKNSLIRMGIWSLICVVVSLLDFWEDKTFDGVDLIWWIIIGSAIIAVISNWNELQSFFRFIMKKTS